MTCCDFFFFCLVLIEYAMMHMLVVSLEVAAML